MGEIQIKISDVNRALQGFEKLKTKDISFKMSWKIAHIIKQLKTEEKIYIEEMRKTILKYCLKDDDGNPLQEDGGIKINPEKFSEYNEKVKEINNFQFSVEKFTLDEFEKEFDKISPDILIDIMSFIEQ